jgi:hypothetical protein
MITTKTIKYYEMAEQVKIAELAIDNKKLLSELQATKQSIEALSTSQKELKKSGDSTSKTFIQNEADLKSLKSSYSAQIKILGITSGATEKLTSELKKENKSIDSAKANNSALTKIRNQVNSKTEEGAKTIDSINKKLDENNKYITENTSKLEKQKSNIGNYPTLFGKAKGAVIGFGSALKALGIGLIVAGVAKLTEALGRNQKIANAVSTVFNVIGIVFDKFVGTIVETVSAISKANGGFDGMKKVIGGLITLSITPLKLAFYGVKLAIQEGQLLWEKSFLGSGDNKKIAELTVGILETKTAIVDVSKEAIKAGKQVGNNFGEALTEIGEVSEALSDSVSKIDYSNVVEDAKALTNIKNNTEALIIAQEGVVKKYEIQAEKLRQLRDDESNSLEERKQFNQELGTVLEEQATAERNLINSRLSAAQKEASLNKGNIDLQNEVLRIKNEVLDVESRIEGQRSEKLANDNSQRNEELANIKAFEEQKRNIENTIAERKIEDDNIREELRVEKEYEKHLLELETLQVNAEEKLELEKLLLEDKNLQLAEIKIASNAEELEKTEAFEAARVSARQASFDAILGIVDAESGIGKAFLIAKQLLLAKELAIEASKTVAFSSQALARSTVAVAEGTAQTAKIGFPQNIPMLVGYAAQAIGIVSAIKSATKAKPKAERGALLSGARHSQGGIHIEAEDGEVIMNRKSSAMYLPLLSELNQAGGGVPFMAKGGIAGGIKAPSGSLIDYDALALSMSSLPAPRVAVDEIASIQNQVSVAESQSIF